MSNGTEKTKPNIIGGNIVLFPSLPDVGGGASNILKRLEINNNGILSKEMRDSRGKQDVSLVR